MKSILRLGNKKKASNDALVRNAKDVCLDRRGTCLSVSYVYHYVNQEMDKTNILYLNILIKKHWFI